MANTNMASEFFVLSALHRLDADAYLTLGNKKAVDIVVVRSDRQVINVEVKGVAKRDDWTVGSLDTEEPESTYVVLLSFNGKIKDINVSPLIWVIPHDVAVGMITEYQTGNGKRYNIKRTDVEQKCAQYLDAWYLIQKGKEANNINEV